MIIITRSRKDLVRKQKACMDYVDRKNNPLDPKVQEAVEDFQRWSKESRIWDSRDENSKGMKWITSYDLKRKEKENGESH